MKVLHFLLATSCQEGNIWDLFSLAVETGESFTELQRWMQIVTQFHPAEGLQSALR